MNILSPAGWLYGRIADLRNSLYDRGVFRSYPLGARTISIGNITAGGTGKTPLVAYVAGILAENGEKACVLTRGYGRKNARKRVLVSDLQRVLADVKTGGDEPVELARRLLGKAVVVADADRVAAAKWALDNFGVTVFVLDDGFQHRRAKRDLDIVCIDATNPFGNHEVLPAGSLREPRKNLRRADAVVITRANLADDISNLRFEILESAPNSVVFEASNKISGLADVEEFHAKTQGPEKRESSKTVVQKSPVLAFCAIGNPSNFFMQLSSEGFDIVSKKPFPDHHYYTKDEMQKLEKRARSAGAEVLLTTAKDAVRLAGFEFTIPCYVVEIELVLHDAEGFRKLVTASF